MLNKCVKKSIPPLPTDIWTIILSFMQFSVLMLVVKPSCRTLRDLIKSKHRIFMQNSELIKYLMSEMSHIDNNPKDNTMRRGLVSAECRSIYQNLEKTKFIGTYTMKSLLKFMRNITSIEDNRISVPIDFSSSRTNFCCEVTTGNFGTFKYTSSYGLSLDGMRLESYDDMVIHIEYGSSTHEFFLDDYFNWIRLCDYFKDRIFMWKTRKEELIMIFALLFRLNDCLLDKLIRKSCIDRYVSDEINREFAKIKPRMLF